MFEVELGVDGLGNSHQEVFPPETECAYCKKTAYSAFTATEFVNGGRQSGEEFVCDVKPTNVDGIWPHDLISATVYICPNCGGATVLWNQS